MEQNDLNKKIKELEAKLEEATKPKKPWYERLIKKTSFVHGFIFSVLLTSGVGIAFTLPGSPFTSGTVISAADVNAKFAAIEAKLSELDVGFMSTMSGAGSVSCGASAYGPYATLPFDTTSRNDGSFNTGTFTYSVPAAGYYRILTQVPYPSYGGMSQMQVFVNGAGIGGNFSSTMNELVVQLAAGDVIDVRAACDDKGGKGLGTMTVPATGAIFGVKAL